MATPPSPALKDRGIEAFMALARFALKDVIYHAVYPSRVVSQADDGTLELQPDSKLVGGIKKVPIRLGAPGLKVTVKPGARCQLGYENGDPKLPYAGFWEPDQLSALTVTGADSFSIDAPAVSLVPGGQPNARQGDVVAVGGSGMTPVPVMIVLTSPVQAGTQTISAGETILGTLVLQSQVYGVVTTGSQIVKS